MSEKNAQELAPILPYHITPQIAVEDIEKEFDYKFERVFDRFSELKKEVEMISELMSKALVANTNTVNKKFLVLEEKIGQLDEKP